MVIASGAVDMDFLVRDATAAPVEALPEAVERSTTRAAADAVRRSWDGVAATVLERSSASAATVKVWRRVPPAVERVPPLPLKSSVSAAVGVVRRVLDDAPADVPLRSTTSAAGWAVFRVRLAVAGVEVKSIASGAVVAVFFADEVCAPAPYVSESSATTTTTGTANSKPRKRCTSKLFGKTSGLPHCIESVTGPSFTPR